MVLCETVTKRGDPESSSLSVCKGCLCLCLCVCLCVCLCLLLLVYGMWQCSLRLCVGKCILSCFVSHLTLHCILWMDGGENLTANRNAHEKKRLNLHGSRRSAWPRSWTVCAANSCAMKKCDNKFDRQNPSSEVR